MVNPAASACSQQIISLLMEGAQELLGADSLQHVLALVGNGHAPVTPEMERDQSPAQDTAAGCGTALADCSDLPRGLEAQYGTAGGRGLALRIGRAAFKYMLLRHGDGLGLTSVDFRLQRAPQRMQEGLHILSGQIVQECGDRISIQDGGDYWVWKSERCPICRGQKAVDPCCYLTVGLLQELLSWAGGGGRFYRVQETDCRATGGPACTYQIDKRPLD